MFTPPVLRMQVCSLLSFALVAALLLPACQGGPSGANTRETQDTPTGIADAQLVGRWREAAQWFRSADTAFAVPAAAPGGVATFLYLAPDSTYVVKTECHPTPGCAGAAAGQHPVRGIWRIHGGTHLDLRPANLPFEIPPRTMALRADTLLLTETTPTPQGVVATQVFVRAPQAQ